MTEEEINAKKFAIKSKEAQKAEEAKQKARRESERSGEEFNEKEYDKNKKQ